MEQKKNNIADLLRKAIKENIGTERAVEKKDNGEYVWVKYGTSDGLRMMWLDEQLEDRLLKAIEKKYVDHITGFVPKFYDGHITNYEPVFDEETQKEWDEEVREYQRGAYAYYANKRPGEYCGD